MPKSRLIHAALAAALSAAAFAGPAAASQPGPPSWPVHPKPITAYASQLPAPPTWPTNSTPITQYHGTAQATDGDFDWSSAGIGAGASAAAFAAGMFGLLGVRRRRHARPHTATSS